jgi:hypothetical protein
MEKHVDCPYCMDKSELQQVYGSVLSKTGEEFLGLYGYFYLCHRCQIAFTNDLCDELTLNQLGSEAKWRVIDEARKLGSYNKWTFKPKLSWCEEHPNVVSIKQ